MRLKKIAPCNFLNKLKETVHQNPLDLTLRQSPSFGAAIAMNKIQRPWTKNAHGEV
jgi:hypothetical protein